jgi:hypothetical protein
LNGDRVAGGRGCMVFRVKIALQATGGMMSKYIAQKLNAVLKTISLWRIEFAEQFMCHLFLIIAKYFFGSIGSYASNDPFPIANAVVPAKFAGRNGREIRSFAMYDFNKDLKEPFRAVEYHNVQR